MLSTPSQNTFHPLNIQSHLSIDTSYADPGVVQWTDSVSEFFADIVPPPLPSYDQVSGDQYVTGRYHERSVFQQTAMESSPVSVLQLNTIYASSVRSRPYISEMERSCFNTQGPTPTIPTFLLLGSYTIPPSTLQMTSRWETDVSVQMPASSTRIRLHSQRSNFFMESADLRHLHRELREQM